MNKPTDTEILNWLEGQTHIIKDVPRWDGLKEMLDLNMMFPMVDGVTNLREAIIKEIENES